MKSISGWRSFSFPVYWRQEIAWENGKNRSSVWREIECGCRWGAGGQIQKKLKRQVVISQIHAFLISENSTFFFKERKSCFCALCTQVTKIDGEEEIEYIPTMEWLLERRCCYLLQQLKIFYNFRWDEWNWNQLFVVWSFWNRMTLGSTNAVFMGNYRGNEVAHQQRKLTRLIITTLNFNLFR